MNSWLLLMACEASKDTETTSDSTTEAASGAGTLQLETVNKIIAVTDPVVPFAAGDTSASAVAASSFNQLVLSTGLNLMASKGVSLGDSTTKIDTAFTTAQGSKLYCDTVNNGMKFFKQASAPDSNLCMVKMAAAKLAIKSSGFQVWDFKASTASGTFTYRMKFSLETQADGSLKKFENFTCQAFGSASLTQSGYVMQTITDGKVSIHTRVMASEGTGRADVQSEINADGRQVGLKKIDYAEKFGTRTVHTKITQSATNIQAIGYEDSNGRQTQYISFSELIDSNAATGQYYITKIAYGDGAAVNQVTESGASPVLYSDSWDGDTLKSDSSESRIDKVKNRETEFLAIKGDTLDITASAAETYDCAGAADQTFTADSSSSMTCYNAFNIDQNGKNLCTTLSY